MTFDLPGAEPFSEELKRQLAGFEGKFVNRLALATSPYLRQHAHNPVNWYVWGDEAFEAATRLGRPVLLSVGYSTCHWCHVMAHESFEDESIAAYMNAHYICITLDREERPDIDAVYMTALQLLTHHGGWPMNVWLDHQRRPFFAGTYFPPRDDMRGAGAGFTTVLQQLYEMFIEEPEKIAEAAADITAGVQENAPRRQRADALDHGKILNRALDYYRQRFDTRRGGLSGAPKFPSTLPARLLLRIHARSKDPATLQMATTTLLAMARGGIYDQVGGGFHRYSTDADWRVPHFEKMLYDNALLVPAYVEAWQVTREEEFAWVANDTLAWALKEMLLPSGAFAAASDADSPDASGHSHEGAFFIWHLDELTALLGPAAPAFFDANAHGQLDGANVLVRGPEHIPHEWRERLYAARAKRQPPSRDDKIITAWNGLFCSALARAGFAFNNPAYIAAAEKALAVLLAGKKADQLVRIVGGDTLGFLDDYAAVIAALLDLFEATSKSEHLQEALRLQAVLDRDFSDPAGGYFASGTQHETLLVRDRPAYDGAEPSGNSLAAMNLLRLHALTLKDEFQARAQNLLLSFSERLQQQPGALSVMLQALDFAGYPIKEVAIVTTDSDSADKLLDPMREHYLHNTVFVMGRQSELQAMAALVPWAADRLARQQKTTAYVCENQTCQAPATEPQDFIAALGASR